MDRRNIQFVLARHYGRKCRQVFPQGDWRQHEAHIASGWAYMARELPWNEARDTVLEGWRTVEFEGRDNLFANAGNDDIAPRNRRALQ
jgi:hypothetical protein